MWQPDAAVWSDEPITAWDDDEWDVVVDGQRKNKIVMAPAETEFVLADGLAQGTHVVELYKRSEPQTGTTQFKGFDFGGGTLLSPPARHTSPIGGNPIRELIRGARTTIDLPSHSRAKAMQQSANSPVRPSGR